MNEAPILYTRHAFTRGARAALPVTLSSVPFGLVCGVVANAVGLSYAETFLALSSLYSGTIMLVVLANWGPPVPIIASIVTALIISLRLALWGPLMAPWLDRIPWLQRVINLQFLGDQPWAMNIAEMRSGGRDAGYMLGTGTTFWVTWLIGGSAGYFGASLIALTPGHPIFFAATASFIATLVNMARLPRDVIPMVASAITALIVNRMMPGNSWYIMAGVFAGVVAGLLRDRVQPPEETGA